MVKRDRPLPDRPFYYIISGHNKSTLPSFRLEGNDKVKVNNSTFPNGRRTTDNSPSFRLHENDKVKVNNSTFPNGRLPTNHPERCYRN
jgi:hypothetical protein